MNDFLNFVFRGPATGRGGPSGAQTAPETPKMAQKRVLGIILATQRVAGPKDPTFPWFLGTPDRFRGVRGPNGTIWTTFGLGGAPAGRPAGRQVGGPAGDLTKLFCAQFFLYQKRYSWGPELVWGPKN